MRLALLGSLLVAVSGAAVFGVGCRKAEAPSNAAATDSPAAAPAAPAPLPVREDPGDDAAVAWLSPREEGLTALTAAVRDRDAAAPTLTLTAPPSALLRCALRLAGNRVTVAVATASEGPGASAAEDTDASSAARDVDAARADSVQGASTAVEGDAAPADPLQAARSEAVDAVTLEEATLVCAGDSLAALDAVRASLEAKRYPDVIVALDARTWPPLLREDAMRLRARALDGLEDRAAAVALWRELAKGKGARVQEACVRAAKDLVSLGGKENGAEARAFVLRAYAEAPAWAEAQDGLERLFADASKLAGEKAERDPVTRAREAQAWRESGDEAKAKRVANEVLKKGAAAHGEAACRARTVLAQEAPKGQRSAAWGLAIDACEGHELRPGALYAGAKASFTEKLADEAKRRYELLVGESPTHRLADDASLALGKIQLEAGDLAGAEATFAGLAAKHPGGDMVSEGVAKAAILRVQRGAYAEAKALVEDVSADDADLHWGTGGRGRHLRAWCNERLGDVPAAKADYAEVIRRHPYGFWMLASFERLRALAPAEATAALKSLEERAVEPFAPLEDDVVLLAREAHLAGRVDVLRDLAGHASFAARPKEASWAFSWLLNAAGLETLGHGRPRAAAPQFLAEPPHGSARLGWLASFPTPHEERVRAEAAKRGVPVSLVWAIMREESAFKAEVKSSAKAFGLMQLIVPTAKLMAHGEAVTPNERTLVDPAVNVALGTKLLGVLRKSYAAQPLLAIPAYNAGGGAVNRWLEARRGMPFELWVEAIPYEETRGYMKRVTTSWLAYARLYAPTELEAILNGPWPDAAPMSSAVGAP
jgi:soluble lytic murein transglycosylase